MLLDNFRSLHLDFADEEPPTNSDDHISNWDQDFHSFWGNENNNSRHHRPMERMYFDSWELPDQEEQEPPPSSSSEEIEIDPQV